jgi:hypothetical protein
MSAVLRFDTSQSTVDVDLWADTTPPGLSMVEIVAFLPVTASPAKSSWTVTADQAGFPLHVETIYQDTSPVHLSVLATAGASAAKVVVDARGPDGVGHAEGVTGEPLSVIFS